jgi:hypothetical protein
VSLQARVRQEREQTPEFHRQFPGFILRKKRHADIIGQTKPHCLIPNPLPIELQLFLNLSVGLTLLTLPRAQKSEFIRSARLLLAISSHEFSSSINQLLLFPEAHSVLCLLCQGFPYLFPVL